MFHGSETIGGKPHLATVKTWSLALADIFIVLAKPDEVNAARAQKRPAAKHRGQVREDTWETDRRGIARAEVQPAYW
jgi:hypothetical protein